MKDPTYAAELLEEIANELDPVRLYLTHDFFPGEEFRDICDLSITYDEADGTLDTVLQIPQAVIMKDVCGNPQEIAALANTGLKGNREITLTESNEDGSRNFAVRRIEQNPAMVRSFAKFMQQRFERKIRGRV